MAGSILILRSLKTGCLVKLPVTIDWFLCYFLPNNSNILLYYVLFKIKGNANHQD